MAQFWWSLTHNRVEEGMGEPNEQRMGPYKTEEEARNWKQLAEERNRTWDEEDER
ncbi:MAG: hypothetical protein JWM48_1376 [Mycobacterium sp.]|nr:hypothetical protein [Mycobacterium sp.]